jgi:hypothetical protein
LYSNNSHFILNIIAIMACFKPVGKKQPNKMAPAKLVPVNMRSNRLVVAGSAGASSGATAGAASPVTAPANDTFVPPAGSLGTKSPSDISIPSATAASTAVSATATSSSAGANIPDFSVAASSAAAGVPPAKKGSQKAKKCAKGSLPSAIEAAAISVAAASSSINASASAPFTADAATTEMQPIRQSSCTAAQTAKVILWYILYQYIYTNLYLL